MYGCVVRVFKSVGVRRAGIRVQYAIQAPHNHHTQMHSASLPKPKPQPHIHLKAGQPQALQEKRFTFD